MKSLPNRPSYEEVDAEDRHIQLSSRTNVLSKSFTTDLWMKVITRAIDDVALYRMMRAQGKELKDEEKEFEESANAFLFDEEHHIPMDDYQVDVKCPKCEHLWQSTMSLAAGTDSICPSCSYKTNWKYTDYTATNNQVIKDISLKELISLWGVEDIVGFRSGCERRIKEIVANKLKSSAGKNMKKKKEQMALPCMPTPDPSLTKPKVKKPSKHQQSIEKLLKTVQGERAKAEADVEEQLKKAKEFGNYVFNARAEATQASIDRFKYIESTIEKLLE